jgi:RNA polymerase sigma factor (TIGR02999 family)
MDLFRAEGREEAMEAALTPKGVTQLLIAWGKDDESALAEMPQVVYEELRRLAGYYMSRERSDHTLQPTALVHEAYLRLIDQRHVDWKNRAQFFGLAAKMMRRVLVNHARDRAAAKRGGDAQKVSLSLAVDSFKRTDVDVIALHEALERLAGIDPRKSRIVEFKFFGGLKTEEIAEVLQTSTATVEREWSFARAWLYDAVAGDKES